MSHDYHTEERKEAGDEVAAGESLGEEDGAENRGY